MNKQTRHMEQDPEKKPADYPVKSYKLLVLWLLGMFAFAPLFSIFLGPLETLLGERAMTLLWLNFFNLYLVSLFVMITKTQRVYYINYVTYKEAVAATEEERLRFAKKHLWMFIRAAGIFALYAGVSLLMNGRLMLDIAVYTIIIIVAAVRTIGFKLQQ